MDEMKVKTPGEKLKEIRQRFDIKQSQLTGDKITRNLISIIENGKTSLTEGTAETIVKNINNICAIKGISYEITVEELMEDIESQANKCLIDFKNTIEKNEKNFVKGEYNATLACLEKILKENSLHDEAYDLYIMLASIYDKYRLYHNAYSCYIQAFQNCASLFNNPKVASLLINIGYCCIKLKLFNEALYYNTQVSKFCEDISDKLKCLLLYNNAICYKNLNKFDDAMSEISKIEQEASEFLTKEMSVKKNVLVLKANCLKEQKFYNDAIAVHKSIIPLIDNTDVESLLFVYCNLIESYIDLNDTKKLKKYIDKCIMLLDAYKLLDNKLYPHFIFNDIALACYFTNNVQLSRFYFIEALKASKHYMNEEIASASINKLLHIAIENESEEEISFIKNQLIESISLKLISKGDASIIKLIEYYNKVSDTQGISDLTRFLLCTK
jgi:tetratricopeptide (TPR) repeat protein